MASSLSDMSFWIKFFKEAGIPAGDAANYAVTFSDNRITRDMLMDLTKDYLSDMGIGILGDVISILKHAKSVYSQDVRDRALRDTGSRISTPVQELPVPKRSTPASRTIAHHIRPDRSSSPTVSMVPVTSKISKSLSARLGAVPAATTSTHITPQRPPTMVSLNTNKQKEVVPVPKKRRVFPEHEGKYKVTMPAGTTAKTQKILEMQRKQAEAQRIKAEAKKRIETGQNKESVFSRLGSEKLKASPVAGPTVTVTGLGNINISPAAQSSVFNRLGGKTTVKRAATSTVTFGDDDDDDVDAVEFTYGEPLEYAGVLKPGSTPPKRAKLEAANKIKRVARKTLAKAMDEPPKSQGLFAGSGGVNNVRNRLGAKVAEVSSTTQSSPTTVANTSKKGLQGRLGSRKLDKLTITVDTTTNNSGGNGVFSRLGKPK